MNIDVLSEMLKTMYESAPEENRILNIHIFGIRYGKKILAEGYSIDEIMEKADLEISLKDRLIEGINLSDHAEIVKR